MKAAPVDWSQCECFEFLVVRPEAYWDKTEADPLFRLLCCGGVPLTVRVGGNFRLETTLWKNTSVKFSPNECWCRKFISGQLETLLPSRRGVGPLLRRSASTLLLSTVKPLTGIPAESLVPWAWFGAATR